MPPLNPTDPKDEVRHVVFEPEKPAQTRAKQYITLQNVTIDKTSFGVHQQVYLTNEDATALLASRLITPIDVALREGIYPPRTATVHEKTVDKIAHVVKEVVGIPEAEPEAEAPKVILGNKLRDAVQAKKIEAAKLDAAKLAAIRAGGKK
jgi:hypothetical protein